MSTPHGLHLLPLNYSPFAEKAALKNMCPQ